MKRETLQNKEYLNFDELVYYTGSTKEAVQEYILDQAFESSPVNEQLTSRESVNKFMVTGKYTTDHGQAHRPYEQAQKQQREQAKKNIVNAEKNLKGLIAQLPESHRDLSRHDNKMRGALVRAGVVSH